MWCFKPRRLRAGLSIVAQRFSPSQTTLSTNNHSPRLLHPPCMPLHLLHIPHHLTMYMNHSAILQRFYIIYTHLFGIKLVFIISLAEVTKYLCSYSQLAKFTENADIDTLTNCYTLQQTEARSRNMKRLFLRVPE